MECERQSQGLVITALPFLKQTKYLTNTKSQTAPAKFYSLIENNFVIGTERNRLVQSEYQAVRDDYLQSADCSMILYAFTKMNTEDIIIITEETGYNNDGKVFKKIPENCKVIGIKTMSLPMFFKESGIIDFSISITSTKLF